MVTSGLNCLWNRVYCGTRWTGNNSFLALLGPLRYNKVLTALVGVEVADGGGTGEEGAGEEGQRPPGAGPATLCHHGYRHQGALHYLRVGAPPPATYMTCKETRNREFRILETRNREFRILETRNREFRILETRNREFRKLIIFSFLATEKTMY